MTEPTDNDLDALIFQHWPAAATATLPLRWIRAAFREGLAKWGTPPAVAGEPCGWAVFRPDGSLVHGSCEDSADACLFALSESEVACGRKPGYMAAATKGWKPQPIYTTPQPTQAQAGAVPLTDEQIDEMHGEANRGYYIEREHYWKAVRDTEAAHGITKGA